MNSVPYSLRCGTHIENLEPRHLLAGVPTITEFMAKNNGFHEDGDCSATDWIEIKNVGDEALDLAGYRLTDRPTDLALWTFPSVTVEPGAHLVVFASGQDTNDYVDVAGNLHTNFKLGANGEYLALSAADGTILTQYGTKDTEYPAQRFNVSYGLASGSTKVGFMSHPTPGAENVGEEAVFSGITAEPTIDVEPGFFDTPFSVTISSEATGAEIRYTTDGRPPTATTRTVYTGPIPIETTTILRAAAFQDDHIPSIVKTHSYLFLEDVIRQPEQPDGLPTTWKDSFPDDGKDYPAEYGMDPRIVDNPAYSDEIVDSLRSIRTMSIVTDPDNLFGPEGLYNNTVKRGLETEKPVSVEIINTDGTLAYQGNAGLRNHADFFRRFRITVKQSLRLSFRGQYGPTQMEYRLFPGSPADQFDSIVLQSTKIVDDDPGMIRNSFARDTNLAMGNIEAHATFVHLYLNGLYWGLYNPFERPDSQFAVRYLGGCDKDYDAMNHNNLSTLHAAPEEAVDGDVTRYNAMLDHIRTGFATKEAFEELERQVDLDSLFDMLLIQQYTADNEHESKQVGSRVGDPKFRYVVWDMDEKGLSSVRARINFREYLPRGVFDSLVGNPETLIRFADRAHKHLFNGGALTPEAVAERWGSRADEIRSAVVAETARWGDTHHRTVQPRRPIERDREWQRELDFLNETYFPQRTQVMIDQLRSSGYYPSVEAPQWNQFGGAVSEGFPLQMSHSNAKGDVIYTLDGSDPRQYGGEVGASALTYDGSPISIAADTVVKARVLSEDQWSALTEAEFVIVGPDSPFHLRVTEVNYHPHDANLVAGLGEQDLESSEFEFIELTNTSSATIDISGVQLTHGVTFTFPANTTLAAGESTVVVANNGAFASRYGSELKPAGEFDSGSLSDSGGTIIVRDATERQIHRFSYSSQDPWPTRANGGGSSLEIIDPLGGGSAPTSWRNSSEFGGSPGVAGLGPEGPLAITEVLAHSELPAVDMVELRNRSATAVDISNWYISNSADNYFLHQIPAGTTVSGSGYHVLNETDLGFGLSGAHGDNVWLIQADANGKPLRFMDQVQFGPSAAGVSMGPGPAADGTWYPLAEQTLGRANSGLLSGDVIISEVHYAPIDPDGDRRLLKADDFEYIELYNRTDATLDVSAWQLSGGVELTFPAGTTIDAQQSLLVVAFHHTDLAKESIFRIVLAVDPSTALLGPYENTLDDGGAVVRLERPGQPPADQPSFTPYLFVDEVAYQVAAPWPDDAVGTGSSLSRVSAESFGNAPSSWRSSAASAGTVDFVPRLAGDANEDGQFDQLDLVQVLQGGKYQTEQPATFGEGDWNGDEVFNQLDLVAALQTGNYLGPSAAIGRGSGAKSAHQIARFEVEELDRLFAELLTV